jgi:short-subunit dehydrogenase
MVGDINMLSGDQTIVVTGAAGRLGGLVVQRLREQGARVVAVDTRATIDASGTIFADVTTARGLAVLTDALGGRPVDGLVNMSSISQCEQGAYGPIEALLAAYLAGVVASSSLSRALLPMMRARNMGHIVNVGAVFDYMPPEGHERWSSKAAGHKGLTTALLSEVAGTCIRVSYIDAIADTHGDGGVADRIVSTLTDFRGHHVRTAPRAPMPNRAAMAMRAVGSA